MIRPDVILGLRPDGTGGGQHHEASAVISREAFKLAADPAKYPEQITTAGLRPWQPKKYYFLGRFGGPRDGAPAGAKLLSLESGRLRSAARPDLCRNRHRGAQHAQVPGHGAAAVAARAGAFHLRVGRVDHSRAARLSTGRSATSTPCSTASTTRIGGLARFAGANVPRELTAGLAAIATAVQHAETAFRTVSDAATVPPLLGGLRAVRQLRKALPRHADRRGGPLRDRVPAASEGTMSSSRRSSPPTASTSTRWPTTASSCRGSPVKVSLIVANRGAADVNVKQVRFDGFSAEASCSLTAVTAASERVSRPRCNHRRRARPCRCSRKIRSARCEPALTLKPSERATEPYWHRAGESWPLHLRRGCPVRPAVPADAVFTSRSR